MKSDSDPNSLTDWLRSSGALPAGRVRHVEIDAEISTTVSTLTFVRVEYSSGVPRDLPTKLVVKRLLQSSTAPNVDPEAEFYRRVAPSLGTPPLARCLAVEEGEARGRAIVLEDIRATHDHRPWPLPPTHEHAILAADALAHVHARWWEHEELGRSVGQGHTRESLTAMMQGFAADLPSFLDALGDALPRASRRVYERVFASSLSPWLRLTDARALTVTHGDAHSWNFLFPRNGQGPAVLIDWQLWHLDVGARDLAFLIALHWYPERRHELEEATLRRYHESLTAAGVQGYSWDDLMLDYRRCAIRNLTFPLILWKRGLSPEAWFHRLECALASFRDLHCEEVLDAPSAPAA